MSLRPIYDDVPLAQFEAATNLAGALNSAREAEYEPPADSQSHAEAILDATCDPIHPSSNVETRGFKVTSLRDLLAEPAEETEWLCDELLIQGGSSLLVARPKVGKTSLARDLAFCVARGFPFLGRRTKQGKVLVLLLEEKPQMVHKQFEAMDAPGDWLDDISLAIGAAPKDPLPLLADLIRIYNPSLVIVDPLFKFTRVIDGNSYSEVSAALEPLTELARKSGCHVLSVHHQGKGAERSSADSILGSTAISAAVDTILFLSRRDGVRTIQSMQRYGIDMPETVLEMDPTTGLIGIGAPLEETKLDGIAGGILSALAAGPMTEKEIRLAVGGDSTRVAKALRRQCDGRSILRQGTGKRGNPYTYTLPDSTCSIEPYGGIEHLAFDFAETETLK